MQVCHSSFSSSKNSSNRSLIASNYGANLAAPFAVLALLTPSLGSASNGQPVLTVSPKVVNVKAAAFHKDVLQRLATLNEIAEEDDLALSDESERLLKAFVFQFSNTCPSVVITDGGHFRAIWRNAQSEQLALIFRSESEVQFVFFANAEGEINRATGVSNVQQVLQLIKAHKVEHLLKG